MNDDAKKTNKENTLSIITIVGRWESVKWAGGSQRMRPNIVINTNSSNICVHFIWGKSTAKNWRFPHALLGSSARTRQRLLQLNTEARPTWCQSSGTNTQTDKTTKCSNNERILLNSHKWVFYLTSIQMTSTVSKRKYRISVHCNGRAGVSLLCWATMEPNRRHKYIRQQEFK